MTAVAKKCYYSNTPKFILFDFYSRTKTLVKNAIIVIDATPFRQWYEAHYAQMLGHKKNQKLSEAEEALINKKRSNKIAKKFAERQKESKVSPLRIQKLIFFNSERFKKSIISFIALQIQFELRHLNARN